MTSKYRSLLDEQKVDLSSRELQRCDYFRSTSGSTHTVYGDITQNGGSEKGQSLLQRLIADEQIHSIRRICRQRLGAGHEEGRARSVIEADAAWVRERIVLDLKAAWIEDMFMALQGLSWSESERRKGVVAKWELSLPVM